MRAEKGGEQLTEPTSHGVLRTVALVCGVVALTATLFAIGSAVGGAPWLVSDISAGLAMVAANAAAFCEDERAIGRRSAIAWGVLAAGNGQCLGGICTMTTAQAGIHPTGSLDAIAAHLVVGATFVTAAWLLERRRADRTDPPARTIA